ncbi:MAG TPA: hypothetical protein VK054_11995 [Beutenbergiaceae bacterium]|nr:hypothetical protein [Beutenbergiaceae bacterium]
MSNTNDTIFRMYRSGKTYGARCGVAAAVEYLRLEGYLQAARHLEDNSAAVAETAFIPAPKDRWASAYSGQIAKAEQATQDRTRSERTAGKGLDIDMEDALWNN